jgi:hypothetical protein
LCYKKCPNPFIKIIMLHTVFISSNTACTCMSLQMVCLFTCSICQILSLCINSLFSPSTGSRIKTSNEFGICMLEIKGIYPEDSGIITCRAANASGHTETSGRLSCQSMCVCLWMIFPLRRSSDEGI